MPRGGQKRFDLTEGEMPDLLALPEKIRRKVLYVAAKFVALDVRAKAPDSGRRHKGKLNKSIRYGSKTRPELVGEVKAKAPHAHLVHDGTKAHRIYPSSPETAKAGYRFYQAKGYADHPGSRKQPFFDEAAERNKGDVLQLLKLGTDAATAEIARGE